MSGTTIINNQKIRFNSRNQKEFLGTLRKRVNDYFSENNLKTTANGAMVFKIVFFLITTTALYASLYIFTSSLLINLLIWSVLGFFSAFTAVNICHDAIHGALSNNSKVNRAFSILFNVLGANDYMWRIMHNQQHHTYTNIQGHDEDIESVPMLRLSPHQKYLKVHKYQHYYAFLFYGLATLSWVFFKDYIKFFRNNVGGVKRKHPKKELFNLIFYKLVYYTLFLVLPIIFIPFAWYYVLAGFLLMHFFEGFFLAIIFMLAHLVEDTHFPLPDQQGSIENNWAVHQMYTTANFGRKEWLTSFVSGGLNFQVEHHLFPHICHIHYKAISNIVQATAYEHGVPYLESETFVGAVGSHLRFLREMGKPEVDSSYKPTLSA